MVRMTDNDGNGVVKVKGSREEKREKKTRGEERREWEDGGASKEAGSASDQRDNVTNVITRDRKFGARPRGNS
jgi:hypothetical protein